MTSQVQYSIVNPFFAGSIVTSLIAIIIVLGGQIAVAKYLTGLNWFLWLLDVVVQVGLVVTLRQGTFEKYKLAFLAFTVILTGSYLELASYISVGDGASAVGFGAILRLIVNFLYLLVLGSSHDTPLVQLAIGSTVVPVTSAHQGVAI